MMRQFVDIECAIGENETFNRNIPKVECPGCGRIFAPFRSKFTAQDGKTTSTLQWWDATDIRTPYKTKCQKCGTEFKFNAGYSV